MNPSTRPPTRRSDLLLGGRRASVVALVLSSVVAGLSEAAILATVAQAAAALVDGARSVHIDIGPLRLTETVGVLLAVAFALAVTRLALQAPLSILPSRISAEVQAQMQRALFDAFTRASWKEQSQDREGHLQELIMNQVLQAAWAAMAATSLLTSGLTLLVLVFSALLLNVIAAIAVLGAAVSMFGLLRPLNQLVARRSRELGQAQMDMASGIGQAARLAEETHVFGVAAAQRRRMDGFVFTARDLFYRTTMLARLAPGAYQSLIYLLVVGGLAVLNAGHAGHVASLGAVVLLLIRAGAYGQQVQGSYQSLRQATPFIERVQEVERRYAASVPVTGDRRLEEVRTLAFENVSFAYTPGRPVLSDISFAVAGGEAIGVVGPSGAGKSTLVQLLLQLRTPHSGRYLVNDVPAEQLSRGDWHARVAYVPQEPRLLHASVADNIRYFREIADAEVERAARLARIHDDIVSWASGYDTIVGPRADAVSGGQQQRICIARALAAHPEILVLDEPTSALDPRSEKLLHESLIALKEELTLFVIAHRMSTIDICNRVMVIADGKLEAFDTAARLRRSNSYYRFASALASGTAEQSVS
jgi:ABC-type multidrug transport system fused ATPase/permease subunit